MKTFLVLIQIYLFIRILITSYKMYKTKKILEKCKNEWDKGFYLYIMEEMTVKNNRMLVAIIVIMIIVLII